MLPSQEAQLKGKKAHQVDVNSVKLKQNTAILELLIQNSEVMGFLSEEIEEQYKTCLSMPSYQSQSEGELLDEETSCGAAKRKVTKKKHIRRRSGSLSRVLSVMGKAMGLGRTPGTSKGENQIIIFTSGIVWLQLKISLQEPSYPLSTRPPCQPLEVLPHFLRQEAAISLPNVTMMVSWNNSTFGFRRFFVHSFELFRSLE